MEHAGVTAEDTEAFRKASEEGKDELLSELITDEMVLSLCVVGDLDSCIKQVREIVDAGANTPVAFPVPGTDPIESAKIIGREMAPNIS